MSSFVKSNYPMVLPRQVGLPGSDRNLYASAGLNAPLWRLTMGGTRDPLGGSCLRPWTRSSK